MLLLGRKGKLMSATASISQPQLEANRANCRETWRPDQVSPTHGGSAYQGTSDQGTASQGHGFGFSSPEINRLIDRNNRLNQARALLKSGQNQPPAANRGAKRAS